MDTLIFPEHIMHPLKWLENNVSPGIAYHLRRILFLDHSTSKQFLINRLFVYTCGLQLEGLFFSVSFTSYMGTRTFNIHNCH